EGFEREAVRQLENRVVRNHDPMTGDSVEFHGERIAGKRWWNIRTIDGSEHGCAVQAVAGTVEHRVIARSRRVCHALLEAPIANRQTNNIAMQGAGNRQEYDQTDEVIFH